MKHAPLHEKINAWLSEPLPVEVAASLKRLAQREDVRKIAVMPDAHLARGVCVGTVVATDSSIFPQAVGGDIGCGMAAVAFDAAADLIDGPQRAGEILAALYEIVPTNRQRRGRIPDKLPLALDRWPLSHPRLERISRRDGQVQLGTLGRGNHFVEFQADGDGRLWLMLHSGSRGMGQAITAHHVVAAQTSPQDLTAISADSAAGEAYLADMAWAREYARQNRLAMIEAIRRFFTEAFNVFLDDGTLIHCDHNHVRHESHAGELLWVHRKGALPAAEYEAGVIPGSMGTRSFHVVGRGCEAALRSSSHGAGRSMSRSAARQAISNRQFEREMKGVWHDLRRSRQLRDEAPSAYKEIGQVMRAQRELTRIIRELRPVLCFKGV